MKNLRLKKATICALGGEVSHNLVDLVQLKVKNATPVKRWDTSKKCRRKPQQNSGNFNKQNNFFEVNISKQISRASEMGMFYTNEKIFEYRMFYTNENGNIYQ